MLGSLLRMAMLAGTGAGMAAGFRHAMLKLAMPFAAALILGADRRRGDRLFRDRDLLSR